MFGLGAAALRRTQRGLEQRRGLAPGVTGRRALGEIHCRAQLPEEGTLAARDIDRRRQLLAGAENIA